jgi:hypothetical protein
MATATGQASSPTVGLPAPLRSPHLAVDDFLPYGEADRMREDIDRHFSEPHKQLPSTHQVWNYWYVPGLYTYLRTQPEKVIGHALVERFHESLIRWASDTLGLAHVTWPNLSLYVDGCQQGLHNDSANGRFGYVYSLTWDDRKTIGGETIVLREGDLFRSNLARAAAGWGLFDLLPPHFNRLVVFDDRMPHGVQRVEGSMDPVEGRFVLHGHISEGGPLALGPLSTSDIAAAVNAGVAEVTAGLAAEEVLHHGPLTVRLGIAPSGEVIWSRLLLDRVARADGGPTADIVERLLAALSATRFPPAATATEATVPLLLGGPLPWMEKPPG